MTAPREIIPGRYWMVTRRCTQRQFFLRPGKATTDIFNYCLAEAAATFGIELIAWSTMSNHYHLVVKDARGELPKFMHRLNVHLAKCLNVQWKRWENLWSSDPAGATYLVTREDVFDKVVYTLANPVTSHLVERVRDWPGASSVRQMHGLPKLVERPTGFFDSEGSMPTRVRLQTTPQSSRCEPSGAWRWRVDRALRAREEVAANQRRISGRKVVGFKALVSMSAYDRPKTTEIKRDLRPAIACRDKWKRIAALRALKMFRMAYRFARDAFVSRDFDVIFPSGTWMMRHFGALCAPYPAPE